MNRLSAIYLVIAAPLLTCSCGLISDSIHQSLFNSEYERQKNTYAFQVIGSNTLEYTTLGFGISRNPTALVNTERKWQPELRDRWWEPSKYYDSWANEDDGRYALLIFAFGEIPKWAVGKDYCGLALADLNKFLTQSEMYVSKAQTGHHYVIGGRGWAIKTAEDRGEHDLPLNDRVWQTCRNKLTLVNGQEYDFTLCYLERDGRLYAFKLFTPEPRRDDDLGLMRAWVDSLYFQTNPPPVALPE